MSLLKTVNSSSHKLWRYWWLRYVNTHEHIQTFPLLYCKKKKKKKKKNSETVKKNRRENRN